MGTGIARLRPGGAEGHTANQRKRTGICVYAKAKGDRFWDPHLALEAALCIQ
jgi:hypothetical protein